MKQLLFMSLLISLLVARKGNLAAAEPVTAKHPIRLDFGQERKERQEKIKKLNALTAELANTYVPPEYRPALYLRAVIIEKKNLAQMDALLKALGEYNGVSYLPVLLDCLKQPPFLPSERVDILVALSKHYDNNPKQFANQRNELRKLLITELLTIVASSRDLYFDTNKIQRLHPNQLQGFVTDKKVNPWLFASFADALMNGEPDEQGRYDMYMFILNIAHLSISTGDLEPVLFGPNDMSGFLYGVKEFKNVNLVGQRDPGPFSKEGIIAKADHAKTQTQFENIGAQIRKINEAIIAIEGRLGNLEVAVKELQKWRTEVDQWRKWVTRKIEQHDKLLEKMLGEVQPREGDWDGDGIDDTFESALLARFAPRIVHDEKRSGKAEEGVGAPVSVTEFLAQGRRGGTWAGNQSMDLATALNEVRTTPEATGEWRVEATDAWGARNGALWTNVAARKVPIYGRVWRPWRSERPDLYSVQFYAILTHNETAFTGGFGNHNGDILCIDLGVVGDGKNADAAKVDHGIMHNHGRQFLLRPSVLEYVPGTSHVMIYCERGTNEGFPQPGDRGAFPNVDGFATNVSFDYNPPDRGFWTGLGIRLVSVIVFDDQESEHKVVREHRGEGPVWDTWKGPVKNLGEIHRSFYFTLSNGNQNAADFLEEEFLLKYHGKIGGSEDSPESPPYQSKMWWRDFSGPWSRKDGPGEPEMIEDRREQEYSIMKVKGDEGVKGQILFKNKGRQFRP